MNDPRNARWIAFEGCHNFRDMGGYATTDGRQVKWRTLFRSSHLDGLSAHDVQLAKRTLAINTIIDLRREKERLAPREETLICMTDNCQHISLNRTETIDPTSLPIRSNLEQVYLWIAEGTQLAIVSALREIISAGALPVVFHCAGGKDRTGILAAIILSLLGVADEVITEDYVLTEQARLRLSEQDLAAAFYYLRSRGLPDDMVYAKAQTMAGFLVGMRRKHGGILNFVTRAGFSSEEVDLLRSLLLEPH